ncbi:hypothetical protein FS837_001394 [Tulasnella sp. UAMH 9824]|nr:hypothetical protein FS837_001394 [Tulasnella sp. UAMH 9824]
MSTGAPSFPSFPGFSSFPGLDDDEAAPSKKRDDKKSSKKSRKHSDDEDKHRSKDKKSSRGRDEDRDRKRHRSDKEKEKKHRSREQKLTEAELFIEETLKGAVKLDEDRYKTVDGKNLFFEDRKGDPGNLRYGRQSSQSVPKYRRLGYGEVLGFPAGWKLVPGGTPEVVLRGRKQSSRYTSSRIAAQLKAGPSRRLVIPPQPLVTAATEDFIALPALRSKARETGGPRPITSFEQAEQGDQDSDGSSSSLSISEDEEQDDEYTVPSDPTPTATSQLTSTVKSNPTSIESWLELVEHSVSTSPTPESKADVALSIVQKALSAHPTNKFHPILLARYLRSGSLVWTSAKLEEEWNRALDGVSKEGRALEETADLWMEWIGWRIKVKGVEGSEEAAETVHSVTHREEERLRRRQQLPSLALEAAKLRFLWRMCVGMAEAGYVERAVAIFQAQTELSLFTPPSLSNSSFASKLDVLEEFWDSEVPRIGETGARGWCDHSTSDSTAPPPQTAVVPSSTMEEEDAEPFVQWGSKELRASQSRILPRHTTDEDEDPYATILFSDIRPFLWDLSAPPASSEYEDTRTLLVLVFIHFLGLHVPGLSAHLSLLSTTATTSALSSNAVSTWSDTRFSSPSLTSHLFTFPQSSNQGQGRNWEVVNGVIVARESKETSTWGVVKEWGLGVAGSPLEGYGVKAEGRMWESVEVGALGQATVEVIRNLFQAVCTKIDSTALDQHWLAFEAALGIKQAIKVSKSILSTHRDSLPRWSAHARLERIRGRPADARKVYEASLLSQTSNVSEDKRQGATKMWWDWAEMEWLSGDSVAAQRVVLRAAGVQVEGGKGSVSGAVVLKAKRALEGMVRERLEASKSSEVLDDLVPLVNLQALLDLLAGANPEVALGRYKLELPGPSADAKPHRHQYFLESLALASTLLVYHHTHTLRAAVPPSIFRQHCTSCIHSYPTNTILLGMWLESERGELVWGRVRGTIREVVVPERSEGVDVSRAMWTVWKEKVGEAGSEVERARGVLARGVAGERSRASVALWLVAIELELGMGDTRRAKSLLYRAVAECPWAKDLYLLPFTQRLRSAFTHAEMVQWTNAMLERSVRLRAEGLEELLNQRMVESGGDESSDGEEDGKAVADSGTKAAAALKPRTSITPKSTILLYDANGRSGGNLLGYWSAKFILNAGDYTGCYYLTNTCSDSITNPTWSSNYYLTNPAAPGVPGNQYGIGYANIGAVTQSDKDASWDTSTGNYNNAFVAGVVGTGQNAPPTQTLWHSYQEGNTQNWGYGDPIRSESNIWDCTGANGECFPFWINPSGVRKSAQLVYIPGKYSVLSLTSDINMMHNEGAYESATLVRMYIVDNYVCPN